MTHRWCTDDVLTKLPIQQIQYITGITILTIINVMVIIVAQYNNTADVEMMYRSSWKVVWQAALTAITQTAIWSWICLY